jgi:uncharacterized membrane protein YbhN (UPF0104 family)
VKKHAWTVVKGVAAIAVLAAVLSRVSLRDLAQRMLHLQALDILLLVVITLAQVAVGVVRWWRLLRRVGEHVSFASLFADTVVGLAYSMFLPTTVGGDVVRAWRAARRCDQPHHAWSTSIFERIAGLLALAAGGAFAAVFAVGTLVHFPPILRWLALAIAAALFVTFLAASAPLRLLERLLASRLPAAVARDVRGVGDDLAGPLASAGARIEALLWSVAYQVLGILFVIEGARALGDPGHAWGIVLGIPLIHVLSMIPVTLGGFGLREGLFVGVLGQLGIESDVALGLAAQWLASSIGFAIVGAIVSLASRGSSSVPVDAPETP